ncbi:hypothetical protein BH11BAC7_BH11BAC7_25720 [soil metagenome]
MTIELSAAQLTSTQGPKMVDVTETAEPIVDIWPYVEQLVKDNVVLKYVLDKQLIEADCRNSANSFDHVLLPTENKNIFIIVIVDTNYRKITGHYRLNLEKEYGLQA